GYDGDAVRDRLDAYAATARRRSTVARTPSCSGVQLIPPSPSSSGPPSNSSGNGRIVSSSTEMETPGTAASMAAATSVIVTAGPPRWNTRAPSVAARAASLKRERRHLLFVPEDPRHAFARLLVHAVERDRVADRVVRHGATSVVDA